MDSNEQPRTPDGKFSGTSRVEANVDLTVEARLGEALPVAGPVTGARYLGIDMGSTWNGSPVVGFDYAEMSRMVSSGDGADSNGEGLVWRDNCVLADVSDGEETAVPTAEVTIEGRTITVYVPEGRSWDDVPDDDGFGTDEVRD